MDGRSKAELQVQNGTRVIVELLNDLQMYYGYDKVIVKTPIVESKLRSGQLPARPLVLLYILHNLITIQLTLAIGFPSTQAGEVSLQPLGSFQVDEATLQELEQRCSEILSLNFTGQVLFSKLISEIESALQLSQSPLTNNNDSYIEQVGGILDEETCSQTYFYHCRKCRFLLFTSLELHSHSDQSLGCESDESSEGCTSLFLDEAPGYVVTEELDEGKINCPKCTSRVGAWSWIGTTCSCKTWIAPSFQITKSKLDKKLS